MENARIGKPHYLDTITLAIVFHGSDSRFFLEINIRILSQSFLQRARQGSDTLLEGINTGIFQSIR